MSQHEEPERGRRARVPVSVDKSHDTKAASANRVKAPREDGNPQDVPVVIDVMEYEEPELGRITRVQTGNPQAVPMVIDVREHEAPETVRFIRVPVSVDASHTATAASAPRVTAPGEEGDLQ